MDEEELVDDDGYPTGYALKVIESWDSQDFWGLVDFIKKVWWHAKTGVDAYRYKDSSDGEVLLHTWGWSGNEEIIDAIRENVVWWGLYWFRSERGGHYIFNTCR